MQPTFFDTEKGGAAVKDKPVNKADRRPEEEVQGTGGEPDEGCNGDHPGILPRNESLQADFHVFSGIVQPITAACLRKKSVPVLVLRTSEGSFL